MARPTKDEYYIGIALAVSKRSSCLRRHYGAVIVSNDEIVSTGYNGNPRGLPNCVDLGVCKREGEGHEHNDGDYSSCGSVHAEQNALISAARRDMVGGTLYLAGEDFTDRGFRKFISDPRPCPLCMRMVQNSGIDKVVTFRGCIWKRGETCVYDQGPRL